MSAPPAQVIARTGSTLGVVGALLGAVVALGDGLLRLGFQIVVAGTLVMCLTYAAAGYLLWRAERHLPAGADASAASPASGPT